MALRQWQRATILGYFLLATLAPVSAGDGGIGSGDIRQVHDPCLIRAGDFYYLYSTGLRERGIEARRSRDLIDWEQIENVFPEPFPEWMGLSVPGLRNLWAPDIFLHDGKYLLYYCGSRFGRNTSFIGLATNKTLDPASENYEWVDEGIVIRSGSQETYNAIDPNVIVDERGGMWIVFGSHFSGVYLTALDPKTGKLAERQPRLHPLAFVPELPHAVEAPFLARKNGYYYLFVSFGACARGVDSTYRIAVGRSRSILGPYADQAGKEMLEGGGTVILSTHAPVHGPGHNAVLLDDGEKDWLVHHFYDGRQVWKRGMMGLPTLQVRPLTWSADGWPLPGKALDGADAKRLELTPSL